MKALGLNMTSIKERGGVSGVAGKTLFGNDVGVAETGEFANLLDILGGAKKSESTDLLKILNAAKENPDALNGLPADVLKFIGQEFQFDGANIVNKEGAPIQVEDILAKLKELKPELLSTSKEAEALEVRDLLKGHDLGFENKALKSKSIFSSGDDFVQAKEITKTAMGNEDVTKSFSSNKKLNGLNQYNKESKNLNNNLISSHNNIEMPDAAVGMTQFKSAGQGFDQLAPQSKVIDLSNVKANDNSSLIDQVTKIIEQNNIKSADSMDVIVKHDELGQFKIEVSKNSETDQLDLKIISKEKIGHNFFVENEAQLAKTLNQSGVKLGNIKMALSSENSFTQNSESGKDTSQNFSQNRGNHQGSFGERQGENSDSDRRRHLWQAFKQNAEYASA